MLSILLEVLRLRESLRWLMTISRRASFVIKFKIYDLLVTPPPWLHRQGGYAKKRHILKDLVLLSQIIAGGGWDCSCDLNSYIFDLWFIYIDNFVHYLNNALYEYAINICHIFRHIRFCIWHIFYKSSCLW